MAKNQGYDLTGQRFGKLLVLHRGVTKGPGRTTWTCQCVCGTKKDIRGDALKSGATQSCGCCHQKCYGESPFFMVPVSIKDLQRAAQKAGSTFGQYVAKEYALRILGRSMLSDNIE